MTTTPETSGNSESRATELRKGLADTLTSADSSAIQTVQNLKLVHQARLSQLTRTAASLTAQYGAGDPSVVAAEAAVKAGNARVRRIALVHQQLNTVLPQVSPSGWALRGHVYEATPADNASLMPVAHLTVFLVDSQMAYQQQYGFAYSDGDGSFLINYPGLAHSGEGSGQIGSQSAPELYIEITGDGGKPLYLSNKAFQPALGSATYLDIVLTAGKPPIGDPPSDIRGTAFPGPIQKP
jgi:hypothetical protein